MQTAVDKGTGNGTGKGPLGGPILTCDQALGAAKIMIGMTQVLLALPGTNNSALSAYLAGLATGLEAGACGEPGTTPGI